MNAELTGLRAEFRRATEERNFRYWSFQETCDQAKIAVLVVPLLVLAGLPSDMVGLGVQRALLIALPVRLGFLALGAFQFVRLRRTSRVEDVDRAVVVEVARLDRLVDVIDEQAAARQALVEAGLAPVLHQKILRCRRARRP